MGAVMTCSLGLGLRAALSAAAAGAAAAAAAAAVAGLAGRCATCGVAAGPVGMRLMRTASSPSLISISAMPDSSSSSISFLILRMSMREMPPKDRTRAVPLSGEPLRGGAHRRLVAIGAETGDHADRNVGEVGMAAERLARLGVGKVYLDERHPDRQHRIAQRDARVGEGTGIQDHERDPLGAGPLHALDELVLGVALEGDELVPRLARHRLGALLDGLQGVGTVERRFPGAEQIQIRAVQ